MTGKKKRGKMIGKIGCFPIIFVSRHFCSDCMVFGGILLGVCFWVFPPQQSRLPETNSGGMPQAMG